MMKKLIGILVCCAIFFALPTGAYGASAGFTVAPVFPEDQLDNDAGFFDLNAEPGKNRELTVTVTNQSGSNITVDARAITATTNSNGIINYSTDGLADETLEYSFAEKTSLSAEEIVIPPGESRNVTATVKAPEKPFDGIILGSLLFSKRPEEQGAGIINRYSYTVAVRLHGSGSEPAPDFELGEVAAGLVNYRAAVTAQLRNPLPVLVKGARAEAKLSKKDTGDAVWDGKAVDVDFAPNTIFPLSITDSTGEGLAAGIYEVNIALTHDGKRWDFSRDLEIRADQASGINSGAVGQRPPAPASVWIYVAVLFAMLALLLFVLLLRRNRRAESR